MRALLVEDDTEMAALLVRYLDEMNIETEVAFTAGDGERLVTEGKIPFDVGIIDFWLDEGTAIPILDAIGSSADRFPVLLITGGGGELTIETSKAISEASGSAVFLQKPFSKPAFVKAVESLT